ncbi:hypothetical protein M422DRAFT_183065, partial [Sphaerobolus stellatus SS14]
MLIKSVLGDSDDRGACGEYNVASDYIIALSIPQYGNGENCGKPVTITYGDKTTHAIVADRCEACPYGAIDLTNGLFSYFAPLYEGLIYVDWHY